MIAPSVGRTAATARAAAPLALAGIIAAALVYLPPARYSIYPQCPVFLYLHLRCPGCGATRALAALLRGQLREAIHLNALTTLMIPVIAMYASRCYVRFLRRDTLHLPQLPPTAIYAALVLTAAFTLARNLPQ